jgi:GDP-4-dehydro-6-deoxy-D-mannose reductase
LKTVLVIGASGFTGRHLCRQIQNDGPELQTFSYRYGQDVRDYEQLLGCLRQTQPDQIHHLAGNATPGHLFSSRDVETRIFGTLNLMKAVRESGSRAKIHIAGMGAEYDNSPGLSTIAESSLIRPRTLSAAASHAAGQLALTYGQAYGIPVVVTRAWPYTGVGQSNAHDLVHLVEQVALVEYGASPVVHLERGDTYYCYQDVRDVVRAYRLVFIKKLEPGVYNIGSGYMDILAGILLTLIGIADNHIPVEPSISTIRPKQPPPLVPDASMFMAMTGWEPEFQLSDTLRWMLEYYRDEVAK